jgi:hypothetical protein
MFPLFSMLLIAGINKKQFCNNCGTILFANNSSKINIVSIRARKVDQLDLIKPSINVFMDSQVSSAKVDDNLRQAPKIPS